MAFDTADGTLKLIVYLGLRNRGRLLVVDYLVPPNPDKSGWWIPAPELNYGDDPVDVARAQAASLGFADAEPRLMDVESFTMGEGNWHLITHFVSDVMADPTASANVRHWKWVSLDDMPDPASFAHRRWESDLARRMLEFTPA